MRKLTGILFLFLALSMVAAVGCQNPPWANNHQYTPQPYTPRTNNYDSGFSSPTGSGTQHAPPRQGSGSR